jgi:hypothetical protein
MDRFSIVGWRSRLRDTFCEPRKHGCMAGDRVHIRGRSCDTGLCGFSPRVVVVYRGEYRLRYKIDEREYYVWAKSHWADVDRQFIQDKVDYPPAKCDFSIRYNPRDPSDALAVGK